MAEVSTGHRRAQVLNDLTFGVQTFRAVNRRSCRLSSIRLHIGVLLGLGWASITFVGCATRSVSESEVRAQLIAPTDQKGEFIVSIRGLPPSIQSQLHGVADAGQAFSADCTGPHAHERFLVAAKNGNTYKVAVEQGGRAHGWFISEFTLDGKGTVTHSKRIEPGGAPNRSQPGSPHTNRTSATAGSGR
jgi:hypothetical protein